MKMKMLAAACAMVASTAFAAPIDISSGSNSFGSGALTGAAVSNATMDFTFMGLASGMYSFDFGAYSTGKVTFDSVSLDGTLVPSTLGAGNKSISFSANETLGSSFVVSVQYDKAVGVGSFGGSVTVTPVPEPETYALMLAGLGAIGFVARRRSAAK
jgi:hypothetical protein